MVEVFHAVNQLLGCGLRKVLRGPVAQRVQLASTTLAVERAQHRHSDYWQSGHTTGTASVLEGKALRLTVAAYMFHPRYLQQWHKVNTGGMCQSLHQGGKEEVHCPKLRKLLCTLGYMEHWVTTHHAHACVDMRTAPG